MTVWQLAGTWVALGVYAIAWVRGGRPERFGAAVLVLDDLVSLVLVRWGVSDVYPNVMVKEGVSLLLIGGLAFRSSRWWPLAMTAAHCLIVLAYGLRLIIPSLSLYAAMSAHVGLDYLVHLTLLFGILERWLAGEPPAGAAAWAKADRMAARRTPPRHPRGPPAGTSVP